MIREVAYLGGLARGVDDVGEHHGRKDPLQVRAAGGSVTGQKFLDVADQRLGIASPEAVIAFSIFDVACPRDLRSQLAAQIDNFRGSQVQKSESDQWSELWNRL